MFGKKIMGFDLRPHGNATGTGTVVPYFPDTDSRIWIQLKIIRIGNAARHTYT